MTDVSAPQREPPLLEMHGIVKTFPGVRALDGVDLDVRAGEVHCLLGQNGAGKSTLIKVLAGAHQPDEGTITWRGEPVVAGRPAGRHAPRHRHDLPGARPRRRPDASPRTSSSATSGPAFGLARRAGANRAAARAARPPRPPRDPRPTAEVGSLSAAAQQIVSMARALSQDARLIIMDEPSAVLDNEEVAAAVPASSAT